MPTSTPSDPPVRDAVATPPVRVAVVFASPIMLRGCASFLADRPELCVVFAGGHDALDDLHAEDVDVTVVGVVPGAGSESNDVTVLAAAGHRVLAVVPPKMRRAAALAAGAHGVVSGADATGEELVEAVLALFAAPPSTPSGVPVRLSQREREVLAELANGCTDREVGERLGISVRTVQSHLDRIREKTGRRRRAELTTLAFELGLVRQDG